jgi:hypothetical protein
MTFGLPLHPQACNIQMWPTPQLWMGTSEYHGGDAALPGIQESKTGEYILTSQDGERIIPSQEP